MSVEAAVGEMLPSNVSRAMMQPSATTKRRAFDEAALFVVVRISYHFQKCLN